MKPAKSAVLSFVFAFALLAGCGGRQHVTLGIEKGLNTARDAFVTWDKLHQDHIVDVATTKVEAETKIAAYRAKRVPVIKAFALAYNALALAMTDPNDTSHYLDAFVAAQTVYTSVKTLIEGDTP